MNDSKNIEFKSMKDIFMFISEYDSSGNKTMNIDDFICSMNSKRVIDYFIMQTFGRNQQLHMYRSDKNGAIRVDFDDSYSTDRAMQELNIDWGEDPTYDPLDGMLKRLFYQYPLGLWIDCDGSGAMKNIIILDDGNVDEFKKWFD